MKRVGLMVLVLLAASWLPAAARPVGLSEDHHERLAAGEVVVLAELPPGRDPRGAQGGTAVGLVHAAPGQVWQLLTDYPGHAGLYPRVTAVEVVEADPEHALVRYVVGAGPFSFGFHVDNYPDPERRRLTWSLAPGRQSGIFRDTWGYWQVEPHPQGALLTYGMAARTVLPAFVTRSAERDGLIEAVKAVRARAEARG
jgi:ribosome-associated toxin RatA of RatAB toxin-antitoxin module